MKNLFILSLLFITACGETDTLFEGVDPALQTDVNDLAMQFEAVNGYGLHISVPINFKDLDVDRGQCVTHKDSLKRRSREIFIDPTRWALLKHKPAERIAVLLHEIGHCIFGRAHDDEKLLDYKDGSFYKSIMQSTTIYEGTFLELEDHYYQELVE